MKKIVLTTILTSLIISFGFAQKHPDFVIKKQIKTTPVKNQGMSGTCWAYATTSFIETEAIRKGKPAYDLSEMYVVRKTYPKKANYYVMLHGNGNFSEGGQAHDAINIIREFGIVPESVYSGKKYDLPYHNHAEMVKNLEFVVKNAAKSKKILSQTWKKTFNAIINRYMGATPEKFKFEGKEYTPKTFVRQALDINPDDYIEFTSYSHHPYNKKFDLEVPDNWAHNFYYNLPVDELMQVMKYALQNGYSVDWDGDVSEENFNHQKGTATLTSRDLNKILDLGYQKYRQKTFENFTTTDDHLMHLTGLAENKDGSLFFQTKNSWSKHSNVYGGYLYMSENYVMLKTIAFMIHKDAIPADIAKKIGLK